VNIVGVEREEAARIGIDLASQPILDSLADHRPLLARDGLQVGLDFGRNALAKTDVEILRRPRRVALTKISHLQMVDAKAPGGRLRLQFQRLGRCRVAGRDATVDGKRQRDQRVAEEQAFHLRQRQNPFDHPRPLRVKKMRSMAERPRTRIRCHPARWKKVASGHASAKASQRACAIPSPDESRLTTSGALAAASVATSSRVVLMACPRSRCRPRRETLHPFAPT
jgi:hypothetical protein